MLIFCLKRVIFICEGIYNYYIVYNSIQSNNYINSLHKIFFCFSCVFIFFHTNSNWASLSCLVLKGVFD